MSPDLQFYIFFHTERIRNHLGVLPQFEVLGSSQHGAAGPASQFVAVVLQLGGQDGSSLRVQLLTPVHAVTILKAT